MIKIRLENHKNSLAEKIKIISAEICGKICENLREK
jgi:hypothetical protein